MGLKYHLAALLTVATLAAVAVQASGNSVRGRVTDPEGLPLPGVVVTLAPLAGTAGVTVLTDSEGRYDIAAAPGSYRLEIYLTGFEPAKQPITIPAGDSLEVNVVLRLAAFEEQVTVKADAGQAVLGAAVPDAPVTATREVMDSGMLPNSQYDDVLPLLPNVVRGPDGLISIAGAAAPQGGLMVNGFNLTDPLSGQSSTMLPLEAVDSVDVFSGGYPAGAGRATGGVTSVHTRTGMNVWRASSNSFFPRLLLEDGKIKGVAYWEPNAGMNGPVIKDRLFVTQGLSYRYDRYPFDTVSGEQVSRRTALMSWSQADLKVSPTQHLMAAAAFDPQSTNAAYLTAFNAAGSAPRVDTGGFSASMSDHLTFGRSATLELRAGIVRTDLLVRPEGNASYQLGHDVIGGSFFDRRDLQGRRAEAAAVWSVNTHGGHFIEAGGTIDRVSTDGNEAAGAADYLRSDGSPSVRVEFLSPAAPVFASAYEEGVFVQDRWTISPVITLDAGVRFDHVSTIRPAASPRVAATVKLPGDATTISGSAGLYADKIPLEALAFPQSQARRVQTWDEFGVPGAWRLFTPYSAGPLTTPMATRWDLEVEHRFGATWLARGKYQGREGRNEFVVDPVITATDTGLLELQSAGASHSRSVEATLGYRGRNGGQEIYVSYVSSTARGNVNTLDVIQGMSRMPLILPDQIAPVRADVPDRVLSWAMLHFPSRITVAPFVEVRSGFPFSPIHDDWSYAAPAGSGRLPWFGSLDLYVNKVCTIPHHLPDARVGLKLYNVASVHTERTVQPDVDRPDFGRTYDPIPRDFTVVVELLWSHK